MIGKRLSHYRILEQIGAGGMGVVYRARDEHLERDVALKVLPAGSLATTEARQRFRREALSLSRLNHPNIETVYDFATQEDIDFLVLEYVPGETLGDRLAQGPLPLEDVLQLGRQLVEALIAAHARGVVHRDLKPMNLRVTPEGVLKVLDFGLACLLGPQSSTVATETLIETRGPIGTPPYMAPEQLTGGLADARTDVYAAGATLYEMATGRRPFEQLRGALLADAILHQPPRPPAEVNPLIPETLSRAILRALSKRPEERQQSAAELKAHLEGREPPVLHGSRKVWRRYRVVATAATLGLVIGLAIYWGINSGKPLDSLAVLPFANADGDPESEYLSDGITDRIIDRMSHLPEVKVIAWSSVAGYKGRKVDLKRVGDELGVQAVLTGSVRLHAGELAVKAELVNSEDLTRLWGAIYNRHFSEILAVDSEIAYQIAENLRLRLAGEGKRRLTKRPTADPEAYRLYLKGRHSLLSKWTYEGIQNAIEHFNQAIAIDPLYAQAYAGLAECYYALSNIYLAPGEAMPRARAAARKALDLDDSVSAGHTALGIVREFYEWDTAGAERSFRRSIELNPSDALTHLMYGFTLVARRAPEEARVEIERAVELDPLSDFIPTYLALVHYFSRRFDQAEMELNRVLKHSPDFFLPHAFLGLIYEQTGREREAIEEFRIATRLDETPEALAQLAHAYALAGDRDEALRILNDLQRLSGSRYLSPYNIAVIYAGLGERDEALMWLEKAAEERSEWVHFAHLDPRLDSLHTLPRYTALIHRIGIAR